jgi:hypothetical protein
MSVWPEFGREVREGWARVKKEMRMDEDANETLSAWESTRPEAGNARRRRKEVGLVSGEGLGWPPCELHGDKGALRTFHDQLHWQSLA